ncbi:helix-turn-helix domain-containing protein [Microvirga sp. Mcv34]|uniref:helix-turn-helix domain-containing protein n=1 Tax=Microvirga sp. Mcv34 TaxID=2926016 RepID=UPI0021C91146|nr:helix-turn-helix domain-containing protein [Microvirga sp. Mcv34]
MPRRHNARGRSTTERFVSLPHHMLRSRAWRSLSPVARSVFIELAAIYNGSNNGRIALSARDAAEAVGCSKDTAARAFVELVAKGFIECCSRGHFDRKSPHASEYRLTLYLCDRTGKTATKAFMHWHADESEICNRSDRRDSRSDLRDSSGLRDRELPFTVRGQGL